MISLLLASLVWAAEPAAPATPAAAPEAAAPEAPKGPDRSHPPEVVDPTLLDQAPLVEHRVGNARVLYARVPGIRKVAVDAYINRGSLDVFGAPNETAIALNSLWGEATAEHKAGELAVLVDSNDLGLAGWHGTHHSGVYASAPKDKVGLAFGLAHELLAEPKFTGKDVKRWARDRMVWLDATGPTSQSAVADMALNFAWFPADHPYGARPDLDAALRMTPKALSSAHADLLASGTLEVVIIGDLPWEELEPQVKLLVGDLGGTTERTPDLPFTPAPGTRVIAVDMPGQAQVAVRMRTTAPWMDEPDRAAAWSMNWAFGGNFLSRLNSNLREEKGYTYGSRCRYSARPTTGNFTISVDVPSGVLGSTLMEIDEELQGMIDAPLTDLERTSAWRATAADWNNTAANVDTAEALYERALASRESPDAVRALTLAAKTVTAEDGRRVAARHFGADAPKVIVLVGDRKAIEAQIAGLGWNVSWLDAKTAFLGKF